MLAIKRQDVVSPLSLWFRMSRLQSCSVVHIKSALVAALVFCRQGAEKHTQGAEKSNVLDLRWQVSHLRVYQLAH
jgi:hypothetical protein